MRRFGIPLLVLTTMLTGARAASAASILVNGNTTFTVNWLLTTTNPDYSGTATFDISNYSAAGFRLTIDDIANTTALSPNVNARMTIFGFGLTPDATSSTVIQNGTTFAFETGNFPQFGTVDICASSGNNCAGGGGGGLNQGQASSDVLIIDIKGNFANGVTFSPIPVKFQPGGNNPSQEFDATSITTIPEPSSLFLLGSGLALAVRRLRKQRAA